METTKTKVRQYEKVRYKTVEWRGITWVNLTPHAIVLNSGEVFPPSGVVARVGDHYGPMDENGVMEIFTGRDEEGIPSEINGWMYIVSAMVREACDARGDIVSPATGHPDCRRDENGRIVSVPGFVRNPGRMYKDIWDRRYRRNGI